MQGRCRGDVGEIGEICYRGEHRGPLGDAQAWVEGGTWLGPGLGVGVGLGLGLGLGLGSGLGLGLAGPWPASCILYSVQ